MTFPSLSESELDASHITTGFFGLRFGLVLKTNEGLSTFSSFKCKSASSGSGSGYGSGSGASNRAEEVIETDAFAGDDGVVDANEDAMDAGLAAEEMN